MNQMTFLQSVAGFAQVGQPDRRNKLAEIDPAYDPLAFLAGTLPRVEFDGEEVLSGKQYAVLGSYRPQPGDRVVMAPVGSTYVILGKLGEVAFGDPLVKFTSSGTWNHPPGLLVAIVTAVGPGAGGGGCALTGAGQNAEGSGGGAGVVAFSVIPASELGATEPVTVGTGGPGGAAGPNEGQPGSGNSSFRSLVIAGPGNPGQGGAASSGDTQSAPGSGGSAGTGQIVMPGQFGEYGVIRGGLGSRRGNGGSGPFGRGGYNTSGSGNGPAGAGFGTGGAGGRNLTNQGVGRSGGDGSDGLVIVQHVFAW